MILTIARIECGGRGSCHGTTFITGPNVEVREVICATDSCLGCLIKFDASDSGRPCDPSRPVAPAPIPPLNPITQPPVVVTPAPTLPPPTPQPTDPQYVPIPQQNGQWVPIR